MLTFTVECDVPADRTITLTLPEEVSPGRHQVVVILNGEPEMRIPQKLLNPSKDLSQLIGTVSFPEDAVAYQRRIRDEEWR